MSAKMIYGMYKGDKFIDVGTIAELSSKYGFSKEKLYYYAHSNRVKLAASKPKNRCFVLTPVCTEHNLMKGDDDYE